MARYREESLLEIKDAATNRAPEMTAQDRNTQITKSPEWS